MSNTIRLDIVDLDDGRYSFYVDGVLDQDDVSVSEGDTIADYVRGRLVTHINRRCLGGKGIDAIVERGEALPKRFEDIPASWWPERWEITS